MNYFDINLYLEVLKKYADFDGRAGRKECWTFLIFNIIIITILGIIDRVIGSFIFGVGLFGGVYGLAVLVPSIAVSIRRLHDTNRCGWWLLVTLIPIIGFIVLIVLMVPDSDSEENQYGAKPS